ncbi:hypothetical protein [Streptomyces sp. NPDC005077]|uniref:hypothetical protein n=1 Tax=Streptomyces sp. NPDC005077 TaxID=3154292 RepID=UPI0033B14790
MGSYNAKDMRSKAGQMLDEARRGGEVVIMRRGAERFVLRYEPEGAHPSEHQGDASVSTPASDDLLGQIISGQEQTNDLLRALVEQGKADRTLDEIIERSQPARVAEPSMVTVRLEEEPVQARPVVIPEAVEDPEPEKPGEPTQDELTAAYEYLGLRETPDGLDVTQKGIQSALGTVKKIAREDPASAEAKVMAMGAAEDERIEFLRCVQIDKLSKVMAKRAAGDLKWLGVATPGR